MPVYASDHARKNLDQFILFISPDNRRDEQNELADRKSSKVSAHVLKYQGLQ